MSERTQAKQLTERDREILKEIVYAFIASGEPVSSRTMARSGRSGLSSASIRNVMADLEEHGYLRQPHTSAGRIPTTAGYHLYIDNLMRARAVSAKERRYIRSHLGNHPAEPDDRMATASHLLSELSHQVGIVLVPAMADTVLRSVEFVPLTGRKVLCVLVADSGFVESKVIETRDKASREQLRRAGNYLTANFARKSLRQIRDELVQLMEEERTQMDRLLSLAIELARQGIDPAGAPGLLVDGTTGLLQQPELSDLGRIRRLFETFTDKAQLVRLLNRCLDGPGVRVLIGEDSDLTSELDFSLVATQYGVGDRKLGSLGIFGPSRMEYARIIPLVDYLATALSEALSGALES